MKDYRCLPENSPFLYGFSGAWTFTEGLKPKFAEIVNGTTTVFQTKECDKNLGFCFPLNLS